jgi:release factor glutamine methyltransferase
MASIRHALRFAGEQIGAVDSRVLLQHVAGFAHAQQVAFAERELEPHAWQAFQSMVARRGAGEPIAYLIGWREFYGRRFAVTPDVLIPRPETELLIDLVLAEFDRAATPRLLDLGTGSGVLAITLALQLPGADVIATDVSPTALAVARENAGALGARLRLIGSDWYAALGGQRFDLIVANPPYVAPRDPHLEQGDLRFEPRGALVGNGPAGDGDLETIIRGAPPHLCAHGKLFVEHGWNQGAAMRIRMQEAGFRSVRTAQDLGGNERVTTGILADRDPSPTPAQPP